MAVGNLKGPRGEQGPPGSQVYVDNGPPSAGTGTDNDIYFDVAGSNIWKKSDGSWALIGSFAGPPNTSGALQNTKTADEDLLSGECVRIINASTVALADPLGSVFDAIVYGVTMNDAAKGANVLVLTLGPLYNDAFAGFEPNKLLFLDEMGGITDVRRTDKILTTIGKSLGNGWIYVKPEIPHILGG